jgi:hypothetical protein
MKVILLVLLVFLNIFANNIQGKYEQSFIVTDMSNGNKETITSYIDIKKDGFVYEVEGLIYGGNYHKCNIQNINELEIDKKKTLTMLKYNQYDTLYFKDIDKEYNIDCNLELQIQDDNLTIIDKNGDCRRTFFCGSRAGLDNEKLFKIKEEKDIKKGAVLKEYKTQSVYQYIDKSNTTYNIHIGYKYHHKLDKKWIDDWDFGIAYYIFIELEGLFGDQYQDGITIAVTQDVLDKANLKLLESIKANDLEIGFKDWKEDYFDEHIQPKYDTTIDEIIAEAIKQHNEIAKALEEDNS